MSKYNDADTQEQYLARLRGIPQPDIAPEYLVRQRLSKDLSKHKLGYPKTEILEGGDICEWIANRREQLSETAENNKQEAGVSGAMGLGVALVGFVLSGVNPLAGIAIACGATGYGISLVANMKKFGGLKPVPFSAISLLRMIDKAGAESREYLEQADGYLEIVEFLPAALKAEFILLAQYEAEVTTILGRVTNGKRFQCYRFLLDFYRQNPGCLSNDMGAAAQLANKLQAFAATVNVDSTLDLEFMQQVSSFINQAAEVAKPQQQETALSMFATMPTAGVEETPVLHPTLNVGVLGGQTNTNSNYEYPIQPTTNNQLTNLQSAPTNHWWVKKVFKLPFLVISGEQGSGKSTLERFLIAQLKKEGFHVIICNPETNPELWQGVECLASPVDITNFLVDFPEMVGDRQRQARANMIDEDDYLKYLNAKQGRDGRIAVFFQETNTYEVHGVAPQAWADALKQALTNIRKWGFQVIFTAHSDNQTSVASKLKGFSSLLDSQPRIDCISTTDAYGETVGSGKGLLKLKGVKDPAPQQIKLENFPKTKDFRTESEKEYEQSQATVLQQRINQVKQGEQEQADIGNLFAALESTDKSLVDFIEEDLGVPPGQSDQARDFIAQELQKSNRKDLLTKFKLN